MIEVVTCPNELNWDAILDKTVIFLAGGITECPEWQQTVIELFGEKTNQNIVLINPRRDNFDITDVSMAREQILWEHKHLTAIDMDSATEQFITSGTLFWFPKETVCPITLYELGCRIGRRTKIWVGCDPDYSRKYDLKIQLGQYGIRVVESLDTLVNEIVQELENDR